MEISEIVELYNKLDNFFILLLLLTILPSIYFIFVSVPRSILCQYYPTVEGKIMSGEVGSSNLNQTENKYDNDLIGRIYSTQIKYVYFVDGPTYFNKKICWHRFDSSSYSSHSKTVKRYPKDKRVTVFYSPNNPQIAVLEPGLTSETIFWILFCALSVSFVLFIIVKSY
jgi:hypothetical protein